MILFKDDWDIFPDAIIDTQTVNTTFVRYSALLRSMGVKNCEWPLQLHDKELQGIDPFSEKVFTSEELIMRIALECFNNPFYYFREICRDPNGTPEHPLRFKANRGNMALFWMFFNHITVILIQIRQTGKSFSTDALMTYLLNIRCKKTEINLLTKDETLRSSNLARLKKLEGELPFYLRQRTKYDIGNDSELYIKSLENRYRGHLPNKSAKLALNVGRGLTSPIFHIDEGAFLFNIEISLGAALAAGTAMRDIAELNGDPYGTIITTTAGKKDDRDGAFMYKLTEESAVMSEKFYDAKDLPDLRRIVQKASPKGRLRVNCTYNHRQLGYPDSWLKNAITSAMVSGEAADRDFGNIWTSGSQLSPFSAELSEKIRASEMDNFYTEISSVYAYTTRWFYPEDSIIRNMTAEHHVMGLDTSDAVGSDDIGMTIRKIKTGEVVAAGNYNETNLITFAQWLVELLVQYPKLVLNIERRSSGVMIIDYLLVMLPSRGIDPFRRIYNKVVQEAEEFPDRYNEINGKYHQINPELLVKYKKLFGFATSATGTTSRTELYGTTLSQAAKYTGHTVRDKKTINQMLGLIVKNGRIDHQDGENDDMVVAWLLSGWFLLQGKNLQHYGINPRDILCDNVITRKESTVLNSYEQYQQKQIRQEVDALIDAIKKEKDIHLSQRLEHELRYKVGQLSDGDRQTLAIDELMNGIKESRKINNYRNRFGSYSAFGI